ncbi:hypothetical protein JAAARDRAFT_138452, partial [Jaapia argillacea MUCL 33604]
KHPNAKPFLNKDWTHFYGVYSLMPLNAKGANVFIPALKVLPMMFLRVQVLMVGRRVTRVLQ